jgi:hypothetical protein
MRLTVGRLRELEGAVDHADISPDEHQGERNQERREGGTHIEGVRDELVPAERHKDHHDGQERPKNDAQHRDDRRDSDCRPHRVDEHGGAEEAVPGGEYVQLPR